MAEKSENHLLDARVTRYEASMSRRISAQDATRYIDLADLARHFDMVRRKLLAKEFISVFEQGKKYHCHALGCL
jgi:hypothetical protein